VPAAVAADSRPGGDLLQVVVDIHRVKAPQVASLEDRKLPVEAADKLQAVHWLEVTHHLWEPLITVQVVVAILVVGLAVRVQEGLVAVVTSDRLQMLSTKMQAGLRLEAHQTYIIFHGSQHQLGHRELEPIATQDTSSLCQSNQHLP
jgi:hypothetical protein